MWEGTTFKALICGDHEDGNVGLRHALDCGLEVAGRSRAVGDAVVISGGEKARVREAGWLIGGGQKSTTCRCKTRW